MCNENLKSFLTLMQKLFKEETIYKNTVSRVLKLLDESSDRDQRIHSMPEYCQINNLLIFNFNWYPNLSRLYFALKVLSIFCVMHSRVLFQNQCALDFPGLSPTYWQMNLERYLKAFFFFRLCFDLNPAADSENFFWHDTISGTCFFCSTFKILYTLSC